MQLLGDRPVNDLQSLIDPTTVPPNAEIRQRMGFFGQNMIGTQKKLFTLKFDHENSSYFNESGPLQFEGLLVESIPNGHGKVFHNNGHEIYIGEIRKARLEGNGIYQNEDGIMLYQGDWKNS